MFLNHSLCFCFQPVAVWVLLSRKKKWAGKCFCFKLPEVAICTGARASRTLQKFDQFRLFSFSVKILVVEARHEKAIWRKVKQTLLKAVCLYERISSHSPQQSCRSGRSSCALVCVIDCKLSAPPMQSVAQGRGTTCRNPWKHSLYLFTFYFSSPLKPIGKMYHREESVKLVEIDSNNKWPSHWYTKRLSALEERRLTSCASPHMYHSLLRSSDVWCLVRKFHQKLTSMVLEFCFWNWFLEPESNVSQSNCCVKHRVCRVAQRLVAAGSFLVEKLTHSLHRRGFSSMSCTKSLTQARACCSVPCFPSSRSTERTLWSICSQCAVPKVSLTCVSITLGVWTKRICICWTEAIFFAARRNLGCIRSSFGLHFIGQARATKQLRCWLVLNKVHCGKISQTHVRTSKPKERMRCLDVSVPLRVIDSIYSTADRVVESNCWDYTKRCKHGWLVHIIHGRGHAIRSWELIAETYIQMHG